MAAFGFSRMLGMVRVEEKAGTILVSGIPADIMSTDISQVWKTSRISTYLFSQFGANHLAFPSFFAVEVAYIISDLLVQSQRHTSRTVLKKILKLLLEETWLKDAQNPDIKPILDFKYLSRLAWKPKEHQTAFLETFSTSVPQLNLNGFLLAVPPGGGKTFINLAVGVCLGEKAVVKIIISPKNALRLVWYATISDPEKSAFKTPPSAWYSDQAGETPVNVEFAVFHFEALERAMVLGRKLSAAGVPFAVFVDESHNFNELTAQRTLDLITLCQMPTAHNHVWASGSPIKAVGTEAIPLLSSIDPLFTPDVAQRFKKIFVASASRANEILQHRLSRVLFKVPKDVIISDRPIVIQHKIKLKDSIKFTTPAVRAEMQAFITERLKFYQKDMKAHKHLFQQCLDIYEKSLKTKSTKQEFDLYKKYIAQISAGYDPKFHGDMVKYCRSLEKTKIMPSLPASLRKQFKDSQSVIKYVGLKVQGEALGNILGKRRAECATALALNCNLEEIINEGAAKTLVFASFVSTVKDTADYLEKKGFDTRSVYADTNSQLNEIVADFTKNPTINPLCATFKSLSTAVPLIAASQIVMLDRPPRDYMYEQTVARICRMGQTLQTYVHEIILDTGDVGNVSTRADEIINWSREQVASILGEDLSEKEVTVAVETMGSWGSKEAEKLFGHPHQHVSALSWTLAALRRLI